MESTVFGLVGPPRFGHEYLELSGEGFSILIEARPPYCDRGAFIVNVMVEPGYHDRIVIDAADCFPRYYFHFKNAMEEIRAWISRRNLRLKAGAVWERKSTRESSS